MNIVESKDEATRRWRKELRLAAWRPEDLLKELHLPPQLLLSLSKKVREFPLFAPRSFVASMEKGNARDPLFLQVWPAASEDVEVDGFNLDPVAEKARFSRAGVIHKYQGRVLLPVTSACAVHCRYCFRRHFSYDAGVDVKAAVQYLKHDLTVREVILSGGDPLTLTDEKLGEFLGAIKDLKHITTLRIHTRLPVVLPERVTSSLLDVLKNSPFQTLMVLHVNHPNELSLAVKHAVSEIKSTGTLLLNQSVLLRSVNDAVDILCQLNLKLIECHIIPYYLHLLDRVAGAAHFEVSEGEGIELLNEAAARLPGYAVPRLVREIPGESGKRLIR